MQFQAFWALIGIGTAFVVFGISRLLFPALWSGDDAGGNRYVRGIGIVLTIGIAVTCAGGVALAAAPPLYQSLLRANPLLFARLLMVTVAVLILVGALSLLVYFTRSMLSNIRQRLSASAYLDQKLGSLLQIVLLVIPIAWVALPALLLYGLLSSWNDMTYWDGIVTEMRAVENFSAQGSSGKIITTSILQAARPTCLSEQQNGIGACAHPQAADSYVMTYLTTDAVIEDKMISFLQRGDMVYALSFDADSVLAPGWVRRAHYKETTDLLAAGAALLRALFSLPALLSLATDLLIGGVISFVIVLLTRGALEHYLLSLIFVCSVVSMGVRYSTGGMIPPPDILLLAVIPIALGSAIEEKIIQRLRFRGY